MKGKKAKFFEYWTVDQNGTKAAIRAGYSEKTAAQQASRLLKDPEVAAAVEQWKKQQHEERTAEAEEVEEFLTSVMRGEEVDNIPLFVGDGFQELKTAKPSAKDRLKAAELLGKRYGLFTENVNVDSEGVVQIIDDISGDGGD